MSASVKARIAVTKDGPYIVTGDVPLVRLAAMPEEPTGNWVIEATLPPRQSYALCRCGRSRMAPFCDYKHQRGFDGTEKAERATTSAGDDPASPPAIGFAASGPLWVRGAIDIVSADGFAYARQGLALCRCGASSTKPFCDGSHAATG